MWGFVEREREREGEKVDVSRPYSRPNTRGEKPTSLIPDILLNSLNPCLFLTLSTYHIKSKGTPLTPVLSSPYTGPVQDGYLPGPHP